MSNESSFKRRAAELANYIYKSKSLTILTGAGISTASGVKDFRGSNGLYTNKDSEFTLKPEELLSIGGFNNHTEEVYRFYRKYLMDDVKPNKAHLILAKWEEQGFLKAIITQNIDNLHQAAGSKNVIDLHGNMKDFYCQKCGHPYNLKYIKEDASEEKVPMCINCGEGKIRPDIVMYGEYLDKKVSDMSCDTMMLSDFCIVIGSSLTVPTATSLIDFYGPIQYAIINQSETPYDKKSSVLFHEDIIETLEEVDKNLQEILKLDIEKGCE